MALSRSVRLTAGLYLRRIVGERKFSRRGSIQLKVAYLFESPRGIVEASWFKSGWEGGLSGELPVVHIRCADEGRASIEQHE